MSLNYFWFELLKFLCQSFEFKLFQILHIIQIISNYLFESFQIYIYFARVLLIGMLRVFIHVVTCTIIVYHRAHYFILVVWPPSTDIFWELRVCWIRVYGARGPFCSWDWCPERALYLLDICLGGLRVTWSFLRAPWVCANFSQARSTILSCEVCSRTFLLWAMSTSLTCKPYMRTPCFLVIRLILSLRVELIRLVDRRSGSFLRFGLAAIDV